MTETMKALECLISNARAADCHVRNRSEDTLISGTAAQLVAAGYRGTFPLETGGKLPVGYANARGETIRREWRDLFIWRIPLLVHERSRRLEDVVRAEGGVDASRLIPGWFREDRLQLACRMAEMLAARGGDKLAHALLLLLSTKEYPVDRGRAVLEETYGSG